VSGLLVSTLLKTMFQRPRPDIVPHVGYVSTSSFPSGHSMLSAVTYLTLGALLARTQERKRLKAFFLLGGGILVLSGWSQSCLSRRPLAHRCTGRLDRGCMLGDPVLAVRSMVADSPND
jgi:hypothetical protein